MRTSFLKMSLIPKSICRFRLRDTANKKILFTFDDGPHPDTTPQVLDLLDEYKIKSIFFVVGNRISRAPTMLQEIIRRGHALGNHSYSHHSGRELYRFSYHHDLRRWEDEVAKIVDHKCIFHRPPTGAITPATILCPQLMGLQNILWSLSSEDWRLQDSSECSTTAARVFDKLRGGDIMLFHDEKPYTPEMLKILIPKILDSDFQFSCHADLTTH